MLDHLDDQRAADILAAVGKVRREIAGIRLSLAVARDDLLTDAEMAAKLDVTEEAGQ